MRRKSANWHESVMGSTSSHLNCYALSQIICLSPTDLFHILAFYSQKYPSRADTRITRDELRALLLECETHPSGQFFIRIIDVFDIIIYDLFAYTRRYRHHVQYTHMLRHFWSGIWTNEGMHSSSSGRLYHFALIMTRFM